MTWFECLLTLKSTHVLTQPRREGDISGCQKSSPTFSKMAEASSKKVLISSSNNETFKNKVKCKTWKRRCCQFFAADSKTVLQPHIHINSISREMHTHYNCAILPTAIMIIFIILWNFANLLLKWRQEILPLILSGVIVSCKRLTIKLHSA